MENGVVLKLVDLPSRHLAAFAARKSCWEDHHERDWLTNPDRFFASRSLR
jgi:hypothetical protein